MPVIDEGGTDIAAEEFGAARWWSRLRVAGGGGGDERDVGEVEGGDDTCGKG